MIRNAKALGLAFIVVVAAFSMTAAAAQATLLTVDTANNAVLTGEQIQNGVHGKHKFQITSGAAGPNVQCNQAHFDGTVQGGNPIVLSEATLTAQYTICTFLGLNATITMNGCKFTFTQAIPTQATTSNIDVTGCTAAAPRIEVHVPGCTITVEEQHNKSHIVYTQVGQHLEATATVTGIAYETHGAACAHVETSTRTDASYQGLVTLKAFPDLENKVTTHNGHQFTDPVGGPVAVPLTVN